MSEKTNGHETPAKSGQAVEAAADAGNAGSPEAQVSDAPDAVEPEAAPSKALQARAGVDPALATRIEEMPLLAQAEYFRTRIDPTRGRRIIEAMKLLKPITYDSENQHNHYKYASAAKVYAVVQNALAEAGLYVRKKLNSMEITEVDLPAARNRQANTKSALTVRLDASFAFVAPDDGPEAILAWERRVYWGPVRDIQSEQALWTYYQRYWLTDALLLSTFEANLEIDARGDTDIDPDGVNQAERYHRTAQNAERGFQRPPPPSEHMDEVVDYDAIIKRGREKNELNADEMKDIFLECANDKGKVIIALSERYKKKVERETAEKNAARTLAGEDHPGPAAQPAGDGGPENATGSAPAGDRVDAGSGPSTEVQDDRLTEDEIRPVYEKIVNAEIDKETMRKIVRDYLRANKLTEVTVQQVTAARDAAGLQLAEDSRLSDILWAVIRDAKSRIENPEAQKSGALLTEDEIRPVYEKIVKTEIDKDTMRRIVHDYLHAKQLKEVTVKQVTAARDAAGLQLPKGTSVSDTLWAVVRDANMKIEDEEGRNGGNNDGAPADGTASSSTTDHGYRNMADASAKKLREIDPETARQLADQQYETQEARLNAYDRALATHRNKTAKQDGGPPPPGAAPAESGSAGAQPAGTAAQQPEPKGDAEPPPTLTIEEEIQFAIKRNNLAESDISTLRAMAKGNNKKLLSLIKNIIESLKD